MRRSGGVAPLPLSAIDMVAELVVKKKKHFDMLSIFIRVDATESSASTRFS